LSEVGSAGLAPLTLTTASRLEGLRALGARFRP